MNKLHIGSGTVYLCDWINIDIPSDTTYLAHERPDLVAKYISTELDYYSRHKEKSFANFTAGPKLIETVCDRYGTFQNIPARANSINKILSRQVFEHFDINGAIAALKEAHRVLMPGGELTIDVPDLIESIIQYGNTRDNFYIRHITGPKKKGSWGFHCMSYDKSELINLCESNGYLFYKDEDNIHSYPAISLTFLKR